LKREHASRPFSILYLIDTCIVGADNPSAGGAEKQLHVLACSLDRNRFRPIVVQLSPNCSSPSFRFRLDNIEVVHLPTKRFYGLTGLAQVLRLAKLARREKVRIIHTFFEKSEVMGWLAGRLAGTPIWVTSRRDLGFKRRKSYDQIFRFTSRHCNKVIAVCDAVKEEVALRERVPTSSIAVVYNGVDLSRYSAVSNDGNIRHELNLDTSVPLVGMIANFNFEIKGHDCFIQAASHVLREMPDANFLLLGDGRLRDKYEEMARGLAIREKVHFLGKRGDVPAMLAELTVSVLSSTSEGLSNVLLESMAAARPVVATRVGGNAEVVIDGTTGYLVPPGDPERLAAGILAVLRRPDKAGELGAAGQRRVHDHFSVTAMARSYEHLYESLILEAKN
jgi:glycosyltransferase involved in cell wall biosynthesis